MTWQPTVDDLTALPPGARLRIVNERTGESRESALGPHGQFTLTLADLSQQPVVEEGDHLRFEPRSGTHQPLGRPVVHRIDTEHLERAFLLTTLSAKPDRLELLPNYPHPFNPETWIPFTLREPSQVSIAIYNMSGGIVRRLDLGLRNAGYTCRVRRPHIGTDEIRRVSRSRAVPISARSLRLILPQRDAWHL